jgi:hypothetical protein
VAMVQPILVAAVVETGTMVYREPVVVELLL